jgi:hypothetical protein
VGRASRRSMATRGTWSGRRRKPEAPGRLPRSAKQAGSVLRAHLAHVVFQFAE